MGYYLTFNYNNLSYGLPANNIQEIFFLPQLASIPEAPKDIIGAVNVRGEIIPVMDLNLRFGYEEIDYNINDNVVIVSYENLKLGIIANEVHEVSFIDEKNITSELPYDVTFTEFKQEKFISGMVQKEDQLILLLDPEKLLKYAQSQELSLDLDLFAIEEDSPENSEDDSLTEGEKEVVRKTIFFPQASEYERKILQKRANNLRESIKLKDFTGLKPVSVFTLNQEFFGIELSLVQEFIKFKKYTPIPCTPKFIVGNINLRGEIITLIDIREEFNLQSSALKEENQAVIVNVDGVVVGIVIDAVNDIYMMNPLDLRVAENTENESVKQEYLQGVIPYQDKMLGVIDLNQVILGGSLLVDEAV